VPLRGLLVREGKTQHRSFVTCTAGDLHPDGQAGFRETARQRDCRQPQRVEWPRVVEHEDFFGSKCARVAHQIGNRERRNQRRGRDKDIHGLEHVRHRAANLIQLSPGLNVCRRRDLGACADSLQRLCLIKVGSLGNIFLVVRVCFRGEYGPIRV